VLDTEKTLQVACAATQKNTVSSQPTTITAVQVESVTRIPTEHPGEFVSPKDAHL
jgi:hypothetical protein